MASSKMSCRLCYKELTAKQNTGTKEFPLCKSCMDAHFQYCSDCGKPYFNTQIYFADDDPGQDYPICEYCASTYGIETQS